MSFILARKLGEGDEHPEPGNRQFAEFGGDWYKVCSMCHGTREALLAVLSDPRMNKTAWDERYDTVALIDHHPVDPLVIREAMQLAAVRALGNSAEV